MAHSYKEESSSNVCSTHIAFTSVIMQLCEVTDLNIKSE